MEETARGGGKKQGEWQADEMGAHILVPKNPLQKWRGLAWLRFTVGSMWGFVVMVVVELSDNEQRHTLLKICTALASVLNG